MNVFELLKQDHQKVRDIFSQLVNTSGQEKRGRQDLFQELKRELVAHGHAEEKAFYPKLVDKPPTHDIVEDGINEHHQFEQMIVRIETMPVDSEEWLTAVGDLEKMVEHHVREEENDMFVKARKLLPADQLDPIGEQVKKVEDQERRSLSM